MTFIRTTDPEHQEVVQKIFKSYATREISIRANMRTGIASPASHLDGTSVGGWECPVAMRWSWLGRAISLRCPNTRTD